MLPRLDMAAAWQPQAGLAVVDKQESLAEGIDEGNLRDQMSRRRGGLLDPTERRASVDPFQSVSDMIGFECIVRLNRAHERGNASMHVVVLIRDNSVTSIIPYPRNAACAGGCNRPRRSRAAHEDTTAA